MIAAPITAATSSSSKLMTSIEETSPQAPRKTTAPAGAPLVGCTIAAKRGSVPSRAMACKSRAPPMMPALKVDRIAVKDSTSASHRPAGPKSAAK